MGAHRQSVDINGLEIDIITRWDASTQSYDILVDDHTDLDIYMADHSIESDELGDAVKSLVSFLRGVDGRYTA